MFWISFRGWRRAIITPALPALGLAVLLLLAAGCARRQPAAAAAPKTINDWFAVKVGDRTVRVQLAIHETEMRRGLMERRDLAPDQGMLFVYSRPGSLGFWMRGTPLLLDIGFFGADGELKEIYAMEPYDETTIRSRGERLQFALEVNQGWFRANGVKPGAKLDLGDVRRALQERGAKLEAFGLR